MINGINSMNDAITMMRSGPMERPKPPPDKDVFKIADADNDGLVSRSELETLAKGIKETTGIDINPDEALTTFDTDQDGA